MKGEGMKISDYLKITQAARMLGVTTNTLRNWEKSEKITTYRHPVNNYRLYKKEDVENILERLVKQ